MIDVTHVPELRRNDMDQNLRVGAALTMTELMDIFKATADKDGFSYLTKLYDHVDLVAHIPLRNVSVSITLRVNIIKI